MYLFCFSFSLHVHFIQVCQAAERRFKSIGNGGFNKDKTAKKIVFGKDVILKRGTRGKQRMECFCTRSHCRGSQKVSCVYSILYLYPTSTRIFVIVFLSLSSIMGQACLLWTLVEVCPKFCHDMSQSSNRHYRRI